MITFECPYCKEFYELDDDAAGMPCRCFSCSEKFAVPFPDGEKKEIIDSDGKTILKHGVLSQEDSDKSDVKKTEDDNKQAPPAEKKKEEKEIEKDIDIEKKDDNDAIALRAPIAQRKKEKKGDNDAIALRAPIDQRKKEKKEKKDDNDAIALHAPIAQRKAEQKIASTKKKSDDPKQNINKQLSTQNKKTPPSPPVNKMVVPVVARKPTPQFSSRGGEIQNLLLLIALIALIGGGYYFFKNDEQPIKYQSKIEISENRSSTKPVQKQTTVHVKKQKNALATSFSNARSHISQMNTARNQIIVGIGEFNIKCESNHALLLTSKEVFPLLFAKEKLKIDTVASLYASDDKSAILFSDKSAMIACLEDKTINQSLFNNIIQWFSTKLATKKPVVAVRTNSPEFAILSAFSSDLFTLKQVSSFEVMGPNVDILICSELKTRKEEENISNFIKKGGATVIPADTLAKTAFGKKTLAEIGIYSTEMTINNITAKSTVPVKYMNACWALNAAVAEELKQQSLSPDEKKVISRTMIDAFKASADNNIFKEAAKNACSELSAQTKEKIAQVKLPFSPLFKLKLYNEMLERSVQTTVEIAPDVEIYPGNIANNAKRTTVSVSIDTGIPFWHSTGTYAAPGEIVKIQIPATAATKDWKVVIGGDKHILEPLQEWYRAPSVSVTADLNRENIEVASPYGGCIYIVIPYTHNGKKSYAPTPGAYHTISQPKSVQATIKFSNVLKTAVYIHAKGDRTHGNPILFLDKVKKSGVPFCEIKSDRIILSLSKKDVSEFQTPDIIISFLEQILDNCNMAVGLERDFTAPFPILIITDKINKFLSTKTFYPLFWPEKSAHLLYTSFNLQESVPLMANHISKLYTGKMSKLTNDTKVANLLFLMYVSKVSSNRDRTTLHPKLKKKAIEKEIRKILASKGRLNTSDTFGRIIPHTMLIDQFGWDLEVGLISHYNKLPDNKWPSTREKINFDMIQYLSERSNKNLYPFFKIWGFKIKGRIDKKILEKNAWLPKGFPEDYITIE